jgi:hypothetical protein
MKKGDPVPGPTVHFLLVYSHDEQRLLEQDEFRDATKATRAYADAEASYRGKNNFEIVLIGSDSIETIMKTHGHYFAAETTDAFAEFGKLLA